MSIALFQLDPMTRKRLRRFRRRRRAFISFWVLLGLYAVSLVAELVCNDRPLYIRFQGRSYFPALRFYPERVFVEGGKATRPDYKALNQLPAFAGNDANYMIFAPVPFGPYESIDPESLRSEELVRVTVEAIPHVGFININKDFVIVRQRTAGFFFGTNDSHVVGLDVKGEWALAPELLKGIEQRFMNVAAPSVTMQTTSKVDDTRQAALSLSTFRKRSRKPSTVRLTFREPMETYGQKESIVFRKDGSIVGGAPSFWEDADEGIRDSIRDHVELRFQEPVNDEKFSIADRLFRVRYEINDIRWPHAPVAGHWLGIDSAGRDVLARILYGLRISMTFGFLLVAISMALGIMAGALQGYYGGKLDVTAQRVIEIWSALPFLYVMILMGSVYGRSFTLLLFCYGIFNWIGISYYVRGEFLQLRRRPFVDAARCMGIPARTIIARHILPNSLTPVITFFPFSLVGAIGALAALDYLGFGLPPPTPSWGELLHQAQTFRWAWWLILYPSLALFAVMLLGVFIGEGIRDAFDPRPFSRME